MFYDAAKNDHGLPHDPFKALVAPRPIGWITAMSAKGEVNLSPYSFFNAVSDRPHMVAFSSHGRKDALTFIEETGEFVCNLATFDLREAMNATSAPLPRGDERDGPCRADAAPSRLVKPPRVAEAPAALECKWLQTVPLSRSKAGRRATTWSSARWSGSTSTSASSWTASSTPPRCARSRGPATASISSRRPRPKFSMDRPPGG